MIFNSNLFLFYFLPIVLVAYYLAPFRARQLVLAGFSYIFYGWANPWFMSLMFISTAVDYLCGRVMSLLDRPGVKQGSRGSRRTVMIVSVVVNLGLLAFFKYFNFGIDAFNQLLGGMGLEEYQYSVLLRITLPLGISFYTFQSMSYTIDVYRRQVKPLSNFIDFACYISMFPQLVAGPIIRYRDAEKQLRNRVHSSEKFARGIMFFSVGMFKKVWIADTCGKVADTVFCALYPEAVDCWYGLVAYSFQIYFDFSAYSDMAIGLCLMFGFVFPRNFDSPYRARSVTEFWQKWHISLSSWLRDYLYIPLGGNKRGRSRTIHNLMIVMILGGLWHGAGWTFIAWGLMHGVLLVIERVWRYRPLFCVPSWAGIAATYFVVLVSWVFFRANNIGEAFAYLQNMVSVGQTTQSSLTGGLIYQPVYAGTILIAAIVVWIAPQTWHWAGRVTWSRAIISLVLLAMSISLIAVKTYKPFIYYIF
ncbi:MAG: MBOAT family protein [Desulfobulbaceae bacterium]|nr:MBOAT family protein [Desulfobulbaceae bacterium]